MEGTRAEVEYETVLLIPGHDGIINVDQDRAGFSICPDLMGLHEESWLSVSCIAVGTDHGCLQANGPLQSILHAS